MAAYSEIVIEQNATFTNKVYVEDIYNNPISLVGYTPSSKMRKSYYSSTSYTIDTEVTGLANGEITLSMTSSNTANLPIGRMVYDLIIDDGSGTITRVVEGIATILPSVTR